MIKLHFDMETSDPDDVMTLAIAATHPDVDLVGVTVCPGGRDQIGLVKHVLDGLAKTYIPVGGNVEYKHPNPQPKQWVSGFHHKWFNEGWADTYDYLPAAEVLANSARQGATLLTGGPLKNLRGLPPFLRWVAQGGFAGDSVVPPEVRLPKFEGKETCPTFNFNGDPKTALAMLASPIPEKLLVSKNVCHGVAWDQDFHERSELLLPMTEGFCMAWNGMQKYLKENPQGKLIHDPLALAVAIDPTVCAYREVEVYREKGEWGSRLKAGTGTKITIFVDREKLFRILTAASSIAAG